MKTAVGADEFPAICPKCGSRGVPKTFDPGRRCRDPWHGESLLRWARAHGYTEIAKLMERAKAEQGPSWGSDWGRSK